ncbi:MAG: hypothetical protein MJY67_08695, partial [Bacteroidales bacterium]|nr:hypothetical protein [Bacteroidales bacterium]
MKTRNYIFAAAITIFAAFSCQKAEIEEIKDSIQSEGNLVPVTFTITNENTKTYLDGMSVLWTGEEKVAVWDGVAVREFSVTLEGSDVSMSGEVDASATDLIAAYPYSEAISVKDGVVTTSLSAQQSLGTQSVSDGALLSVATFTKGEDVTFRNVCSLLKVTVEEETANLKEIVIDAPGICGEVQIDAASAQVVSMGDASSIRVSRSDSENIVPGVYCVAVIPGQYKAGELKVRMAYADAGDGVQAGTIEQAAVTGKDVTLQRNKAYDFASTTATGTAERHIHNAEELVAWNSLESGMNTYPVFLDGDCDMSGKPWKDTGLATSFNVQNHKIYNFLTGNAGD